MRCPCVAILVTALALSPAPTAAADETGSELAPRHRHFLAVAELLLDDTEREAFLALTKDYQRDAFVRRFWEVRDPWPETARNELRERWELRAEEAGDRFGDLTEDRSRMWLLNGAPTQVREYFCSGTLRPLAVWRYAESDLIPGSFALVFTPRSGRRDGPWQLWYPSAGLGPLLLTASVLGDLRGRIAAECPQGSEILGALSEAIDWQEVESRIPVVPHPGSEWALAFAARSTDLPPDAEPLPAELELRFPGRHQSRTVVEAVVTLPTAEVRPGRHYLVDGEILRHGELFESFRYRFEPPRGELSPSGLPLVLQRHLRPGEYELVIKVTEGDSPRVFREKRRVEVPRLLPPSSPERGNALAEAHASLGTGENLLRLLEPPRDLLVGNVRLEARAEGPELSRVAFWVDGKKVLQKTRPPYSVEVDLGSTPQLHVVRAAALDGKGRELASDEIVLNAGPHRFGLRILEPLPGRPYRESLRVRAQVDVPEGEVFDRMEIYLGDERVGTLYQPPFDHPIRLPPGDPPTFVRVTAWLVGGATAESSVLINVPGHHDALRVELVELYTTVVDRSGKPVEGLTAKDFRVTEEGEEVAVERFATVLDRPIHAGLLIDTSTSMVEEIAQAERAAAQFLRTVLRPGDRAAVMTFNDAPRLEVPFTDDLEVLAGGLAGLDVEGETALWDSLVYAIYYLSGIKGKRALVLLSDGEDSQSRHSFQETLEFAHRTGVTLYTIGLLLPTRAIEARTRLRALARETGGEAFFIESAGELQRVYRQIKRELRSQYLLVYQSSAEGDDHDFRRVEVEALPPGLTTKTISGYYP